MPTALIPLTLILAVLGPTAASPYSAAPTGGRRTSPAADTTGAATHTPNSPDTPGLTTLTTSEPLLSRGRLGGVSVDRAGNIYVSNFAATVWRVAPDGSVRVLARNLRGSSGNAVGPEGNLFQASFLDGRIFEITPEGEATELVTSGLEGPVGLATDDQGFIYVCNCRGNSVSRVEPDGSVAEFARSPDFDCPNGIAIGPGGVLYIASFNNGHIARVEPGGRVTRFATVPGGRNAHIVFGGGSLWVTKIETHSVYRLGLDGSVERYAGTGEKGFSDGPLTRATLAYPNGIAVSPNERALIVNTLEGEWRGDVETRIVLRRIELPETE